MHLLTTLYSLVANALCAIRARLLWLFGRDDDADNDD